MEKKRVQILDFLRFGGVSESDFKNVKGFLAQNNHTLWRLTSIILEIIFFIAFVVSVSSPTDKPLFDYFPIYVVLVAYFMVVALLLLTCVKPKSKVLLPLIYLSAVVTLALLLYQGFRLENTRYIASYAVMLVALSFLIVDRPYRVLLLYISFLIAFIFLTLFRTKIDDPQDLYPDLFLGIVTTFMACFLSFYHHYVRLRDLVMRYRAEQERDVDSLTGVKNQNAYNRMTNILMSQARRENFPFALVIFDVNGLKLTNDTYGHEYGDELLIRAADLISSSFPKSIIYRIGGDEFATFITGEEYLKRFAIISEFRKHIATLHKQATSLKDDCSIACGFASFNEKEGGDYVSLFSKADMNMYENKRIIKANNKFLEK